MLIQFTDAELDYIGRLLLARPMAEVEPLVTSIRLQVSHQHKEKAPAGMPEGAHMRLNGGDGVESLPLP